MTTFGDRGHDHLRDDPPLSTADMAQAGGRAQADTVQTQAASSRSDAPARTAEPDQAPASGGHAGADPGPGLAPGPGSSAPASAADPSGGPPAGTRGPAGAHDASAPPASAPPASARAASAPAGTTPTAGAPAATPAAATTDDDGRTPLFTDDRSSQFRSRWTDVQAGFVDEPRSAVEQADGLVAEVMQQLARTFAEERTRLESEWERQGDVSTEDLRQALRRYRSFFDRLLTL